ncbi:MAG: hypothetical protein CM1200mP39_09840 [Dehalococcoidia bacterium]|nr:MAG: hypothetical protein CM1200mP39_09840 [Dehalococcoidia bacterium]
MPAVPVTRVMIVLFRIFASDTNYTVDEIKAIGAKTSRQYSVENLPNGVDAWKILWVTIQTTSTIMKSASTRHTIWPFRQEKLWQLKLLDQTSNTRKPSQNVKKHSCRHQTWEEGAQDRWRGRKLPTFTGSVVNATGPMYPNWVIVGNLVILCDGIDAEEALARCYEMKEGLIPTAQ